MDIFTQLQPLTRQIEQTLKASVQEGFPRTLKEPIRYFLDTPGKRIRPLLTLLSCQAVGGKTGDALSAAAGIELFHDFTLIHDDIMDQDEMRRGRSTIHTLWDESTAILAGDALVGMAYASLLKSEPRYLWRVMDLFSEGLIKVCEGQALDTEFEQREEVRPEEYLDMIHKKTAWLFKMSCQIGAILGGASESQVEDIHAFGENLGMGFQIQDDLLDFVADESKLGKKVGSDLKMGKKTYVALKYNMHLQRNPGLAGRYPDKMRDFTSLQDLKEALESLGIVAEIQAVADDYIEKALQSLGRIQPLTDDNPIYRIVRFLQTRQY